MSRITGSEARNLMEAYQSMYAPTEEVSEDQIWEEVENWVNSLLEEGHDLSEYTWEDMYEAYIQEASAPPVFDVSKGLKDQQKKNLESSINQKVQSQVFGDPLTNKDARNVAIGRAQQQQFQNRFSIGPGGFQFKKGNQKPSPPNKPPSGQKPSPTGAPSGSVPATAKTAPSTSSTVLAKKGGVEGKLDKATGKFTAGTFSDTERQRYTTRSGATGSPATAKSATPMQQWAKANPKLAAASAERERTRGTSSTTNPLMKDMKSSLPAPKSPSPSTTQVAFSKSTPSLATTPTKAIAAAPSTSPAASGSVAPATAKIASATKQPPVAPSAPKPASTSFSTKPGDGKPYKDGPLWEGYDAYDIVLEYLLSHGHVESVEEALYVMLEMEEETIQNIVEGSYEDRISANNERYNRNRKRAAQRAAARNAARDAGQTGAVRGVGYVSPRRERETYTDSSGTERHQSGAKAK
jgi:hypothetical protein